VSTSAANTLSRPVNRDQYPLRSTVEVKIGVQSITRELEIETNSSAEEVERSLAQAVASGGLFILPDDKGGKILVPADKIGYVEFTGSEQRRVGFGSL
jgi:hypothetical protein